MAFWIPWIIDALTAGVLVYFFQAGIADGSVSSFNMSLWLGMLAVVGGVLGGSLWLRARNRRGPAVAVSWLVAAPALLFFLLLLAFVVLRPDFK